MLLHISHQPPVPVQGHLTDPVCCVQLQACEVSPSSTAFIRAPLGCMLLAGVFTPVGYQPSWKYCCTRAALPAAMGVAMDVPLSRASTHSELPVVLQSEHGQSQWGSMPVPEGCPSNA